MAKELLDLMWEEFKTIHTEYLELKRQEDTLRGRICYLELSLSRMRPYVRQTLPGWFRKATQEEERKWSKQRGEAT